MKPVRFKKDDAVGIITVDNPPINLTTVEVMQGLTDALDELETADVRAVLLNAQGNHFNSGVDIAKTFQGLDSSAARRMLARAMAPMTRLDNLNVPVICAVQGLCLAAGLEIALRCDVIFAAEDAKFAQVEQRIGAATYLGGAYLLAERCGSARAREICFTGDFYDAASFERWNIINRVVPREELHAQSLAFAQRVASGPTKAHYATKRMVRHFIDNGIRSADEAVIDIGAPIFDTADFKAGVDAIVTHGSKNFQEKVAYRGS